MAAPLRIGMFGGGTVGGGVYEIIENRKKGFFGSLGADVSVTKICVRDVNKPRDYMVGSHTKFVTDYDEILEDTTINCVIELMGGTTHAKDVVFRALASGKHVITANKALLAQYLPEIQDLLRKSPGVQLRYEAAVCGGIPIINTLQNDYVGDSITKIMGIMNGTTNFMLTKMELEGARYEAVLKEAQDLGFAEADPTADVEGHDVQAKIALLAKLAFGMNVPLDAVPCKGISKVTAADFKFAALLNSTIKLVGTATVTGSGDSKRLSVFVSPVVVPLHHPLGTTRGAGNIVVIDSENLVQSTYAGPGAGRYPTANSVVSDVIRQALGNSAPAFPFDQQWSLDPDFSSKFYVRVPLAKVAASTGAEMAHSSLLELAEKSGVHVTGNTNHPEQTQGEGPLETVVLLGECKLSQVAAYAEAIEQQSWAQGQPVFLALL